MQVKVLYILGTQRGGSTIAGRLVGALPGFAYGGEMRRLWERGLDPDVRCGCGADHATCPVWSVALPVALEGAEKAQARAWQRAAAPDRRSGLSLLGLLRRGRVDAADDYTALMARLYTAFGEASGARVVVDGSKLPADAFIALATDDAYVLHLVRDPRGVAYSLVRRAHRRAPVHGTLMVKAAALWAGRNVAASAIRRVNGDDARFMTLRYEDLVADPQAALTRVAAFVGEAAAPVVSADNKVVLPTAHTPTGNGQFVGETVALTEDRAWTTALGRADRALVSALTAPLRRRFGYR
jgi:hypothetical protein